MKRPLGGVLFALALLSSSGQAALAQAPGSAQRQASPAAASAGQDAGARIKLRTSIDSIQSQGSGSALRGSLPVDDVTGALPSHALRGGIEPRDEGLFGTVELPVRQVVSSPRWRAILEEGPAAYFVSCPAGVACEAPLRRAYGTIRAAHPEGLSLDMLRDVNGAVNRLVRFQSDIDTWGAEDYWASPADTAAKGAGDCEDFAIAKLGMLAALGAPLTTLRIAVVKDLQKGIGHAVLVVRVGGVSWILDNQAVDVRPDRAVLAYKPLYSVASDGAWVHGVRRGVPVPDAGQPTQLALRPSMR